MVLMKSAVRVVPLERKARSGLGVPAARSNDHVVRLDPALVNWATKTLPAIILQCAGHRDLADELMSMRCDMQNEIAVAELAAVLCRAARILARETDLVVQAAGNGQSSTPRSGDLPLGDTAAVADIVFDQIRQADQWPAGRWAMVVIRCGQELVERRGIAPILRDLAVATLPLSDGGRGDRRGIVVAGAPESTSERGGAPGRPAAIPGPRAGHEILTPMPNAAGRISRPRRSVRVVRRASTEQHR